jgi:hypothetical protein
VFGIRLNKHKAKREFCERLIEQDAQGTDVIGRDWAAFSFANFSLGIQRKVGRLSCAASGETKKLKNKKEHPQLKTTFTTSKKGTKEKRNFRQSSEENILQ